MWAGAAHNFYPFYSIYSFYKIYSFYPPPATKEYNRIQ